MPFQLTRPLTTCPHAVGNINEKKIKPFPLTALSVLSSTPRLFLLSKTFRAELRLSRSVTRNRIRLHATEFNNTVAVCSSATCAAADTANGYYIYTSNVRVYTRYRWEFLLFCFVLYV